MKKFYYLSFIIGLSMPLITSCSAPEPENGKDINETIFSSSDDSENANPLADKRLTSFSSSSSSNFSESFYAYYHSSGQPDRANYQKQYQSNSIDSSFIYEMNMNYTWATQYPEGIKIFKTAQINDYETQLTYLDETIEISDMVFEDNLLMGFNYISSEETESPIHQISFSYVDNRLTLINIDGNEYSQKWDDNGDLVEINSPFYGSSRIQYTEVENTWGQWDPQLPLLGFFQSFGWFGNAPVHFPKMISTSAPVYGNYSGTSQAISLDYYLSWYGYVTQIKATAGSNSEKYLLDLNYNTLAN